MSLSSILSLLCDNPLFLHPSETELSRLLPGFQKILPQPQAVFLEGEMPTTMRGMPVVESEALSALDQTLEEALEAETLAQLALQRRTSYQTDHYKQA